jgi:hypothetical protein
LPPVLSESVLDGVWVVDLVVSMSPLREDMAGDMFSSASF